MWSDSAWSSFARMKKGPSEVTDSYRTENMYQMCVVAQPPSTYAASVHAPDGLDNVYFA